MSTIPILLWNIFAALLFQDYDRSRYPQQPGDNPDLPDTGDFGFGDFFWPSFNPTIVWVAFIIGILIYFFGYVAGGKLSFGKIILCIIVSSIIGFFSRSVLNPVFSGLVNTFGVSLHTAFVITSTIWMFFVIGIGVMLYEILTVTAEEAHPD